MKLYKELQKGEILTSVERLNRFRKTRSVMSSVMNSRENLYQEMLSTNENVWKGHKKGISTE